MVCMLGAGGVDKVMFIETPFTQLTAPAALHQLGVDLSRP